MPSDDEILRDYERELGPEVAPAPRSNRRFWLVLGAIGVASAIMVVEIFANLGIKDSIAHAQFSLRQAQGAAEAIAARSGTLGAADAESLAETVDGLTFVGPNEPSDALDEVSVASGVQAWAAAVQVRPGACFYLRIGGDEVTYGSGTVCTGLAGLQARDDRW